MLIKQLVWCWLASTIEEIQELHLLARSGPLQCHHARSLTMVATSAGVVGFAPVRLIASFCPYCLCCHSHLHGAGHGCDSGSASPASAGVACQTCYPGVPSRGPLLRKLEQQTAI
eukprot:141814-Amphidinium_carterae.1